MRPIVDYNEAFAPIVHLGTKSVSIDIETQKG